MKSKMLKKILMALVLLGFTAGPAFATAITANNTWIDPTGVDDDEVIIADDDTTSVPAGPGIFGKDLKFSVGVRVIYTGEASKNYFVLGTNNIKGTKYYATASNSSKLYIGSTEVAAGTALASLNKDKFPTPASDATFASASWGEVGR